MDEIDKKSVDIELPFRIGNCNFKINNVYYKIVFFVLNIKINFSYHWTNELWKEFSIKTNCYKFRRNYIF